MKNYRPISNLNFISKIIEKIVVRRIHQHNISNGLNEVFQSAYKAGHSTETALLCVQNDIIQMAEEHDNAALVLLDLSAAFDTVDHNLLLQRLKSSFGIDDVALMWFKQYLTSRTQQVILNGSKSSPVVLQCGVPQGSVLGPYLFTMYTAPLGAIIRQKQIKYQLYADDTQLMKGLSLVSLDSSRQELCDCITNIKNWMTSNGLRLNDDKTELILIRKKRTPALLDNMVINNHKIEAVKFVRNLGFYFDEHLTMVEHITRLCQVLHFQLRTIKKVRNILDQDTTKLLIHSLVTSRLDYCNSLLYGLPKYSLNRLQCLQNKAARIIAGTKLSDHITPVLRSLHWLPVEKRIVFKIACIVFNVLNNNDCPVYLKSQLQPYTPNRTLRSSSSNLLCRKKSKNKFLDRAFSYSGPLIWNSLSEKTRLSTDCKTFKRNLKTELFKSHYGYGLS